MSEKSDDLSNLKAELIEMLEEEGLLPPPSCELCNTDWDPRPLIKTQGGWLCHHCYHQPPKTNSN